MLNKKRILLIAVAFIAAASMVLTGCSAVTAQSDTVDQPANSVIATNTADKVIDIEGNVIVANKMTVSATGIMKVMPDVAYLTVGVTTQNKDMKKAQSSNRETMNALYEALTEAGLTEDEIRTTSYSVNPIYDYNSGARKISNYQATNMIELTIKDIDTIGDFIDIAAESGANTGYYVNFDLLDENTHYNEALAEAVKNAKSKADTIADAGGYEIIGTLEIAESSGYYSPQYYKYDMAAEAEDAATPISAGELEVSANVTVIYQIN